MNPLLRRSLAALLLAAWIIPARGQDRSLETSLTLSGHLIWGVAYRYTTVTGSAVRAGMQVCVPHFKPVGAHIDWLYGSRSDRKNALYGGAGFNLLVARDRGKWKSLVFFKGILGYQRRFRSRDAGYLEIWPAYFPAQGRFAPLIGLNFGYAGKLE